MKTFSYFVLIMIGNRALFVNSFLNFEKKFFEIIPDRFEILHETPDIVKWTVKVKRINNIRAITGMATLFVPVGNEYSLEIKLLKKQGGEYRYMPYKLHKSPVCELVQKDTYFYPDLVKGSNFPADTHKNCPFAAGNYTMYNVTADLHNVPGITQFGQSGDYCAEVDLTFNNKLIAEYRIYAFVNNV